MLANQRSSALFRCPDHRISASCGPLAEQIKRDKLLSESAKPVPVCLSPERRHILARTKTLRILTAGVVIPSDMSDPHVTKMAWHITFVPIWPSSLFLLHPHLSLQPAFQDGRHAAETSDCHVQGRGGPSCRVGRGLWFDGGLCGYSSHPVLQEEPNTAKSTQ